VNAERQGAERVPRGSHLLHQWITRLHQVEVAVEVGVAVGVAVEVAVAVAVGVHDHDDVSDARFRPTAAPV
jgi:hypothetical protein